MKDPIIIRALIFDYMSFEFSRSSGLRQLVEYAFDSWWDSPVVVSKWF